MHWTHCEGMNGFFFLLLITQHRRGCDIDRLVMDNGRRAEFGVSSSSGGLTVSVRGAERVEGADLGSEV